eukprot:COSAG02_NODE_21005_length_806_cov_1.826025_1_plen_86_part_00
MVWIASKRQNIVDENLHGDRLGDTPIHRAARLGQAELRKQFLQLGADTNLYAVARIGVSWPLEPPRAMGAWAKPHFAGHGTVQCE